jgi:hypothetical protein
MFDFDPDIEATCSSKMLVEFEGITRRFIPEDRILHNHLCENLESHTSFRCLNPVKEFIVPQD